MKHQKNLHVIYILTKLELGGAQKICLALFNGLHDYGIATHLITGTEGVLAPSLRDKKNVTMLTSFKREISYKGLLQDFICLKELITQLRAYKKKYSNLIVHTHSTKAGTLGRIAAWCAGIRVIHTIHGYGFHDYQSRITWFAIYLIELILSLFTTHFICVSRQDAKTGIRLFPGFKEKHTIILAAVDNKDFTRQIPNAPRYPHNEQPFVFGTISCFKPQKNLRDLITAFARVHGQIPQTRLEIIGDGIQRAELEALIQKHGLTSAVILHGWQHNVQNYLASWHTFVLSSLWEGLPCAVIEARLLHIPVVCYDTGGINEVIISGENGFLAPRGDWQQLADYMLAVASSEKIYASLQAHNDNLSDFSMPTMLEEHHALYRAIAYERMYSLSDEF